MRNPNSRIPLITDYVSPAGNRKKELFTPKFDGKRITLVSSGTIDVQDKINAYAPFCDISYMLSRLKVGDASVLNSSEPMYGDFSTLPRNPIDAINLVNDAELAFATLDEETRMACNNDWRIFLARSIDGTLHSSSGSDDNNQFPNSLTNPLKPDVVEHSVTDVTPESE